MRRPEIRRLGTRWPAPILRILLAMVLLTAPAFVGAQEPPVLAAADSLLARLLPSAVRASVIASSPSLAVRRAEITAAEARLAATGFAPAALLSVESEDARNARLHEGSTRLEVSREFLSGARRRGARTVAEAEVRIAQVALDAEERRALAAAARALYGAVGWRAIARRLGAQDSLLASAEGSVRARFGVGEARYVDVLRLRTERLRVQTDQAMAETEADASTIALETLVGGDTVALRAAAAEMDSAARRAARPAARTGSGTSAMLSMLLPEAPPVDSLLGLVADIQLADARIAQARAQRQLVLARQRPAFSASVGIQRIGPDGGEGATFGPVLSAGMTLPFTAARGNRAALAAAEQQTAVAVTARGAAAVGVRGALATARARYEAARRRAATFDATLLQAAREERESALAAYRTTDISLLELLDFERALARAEIERTLATLDAVTALAELLSGAPSPVASGSSPTTHSEAGTSRDADDR